MTDPFDLTEAPTPAAAPAEPPYLQGLNTAQREAVLTTDGPVLMLAGAGTGKTRALTTRLAHILRATGARPWQVLAVTFTNKAAREMRERVGALLGVAMEGWWVGTFHATAARMLRVHAELIGLTPQFTILDADDQVRLIKQLIQARDMDDKRWPARVVLGVIQRWKDRGLTPDRVTDAEGAEFADGHGLPIYQEYQERLRTLNACDFGDLLLHCLTLFSNHPDVLAKYQDQFHYVLVDEYQDTNVAQYLWLRLLAQGHRNICCVGDDDQSIYSWRGAEVGNILRFESDFPGAAVIRLERNYRSTGHILGAASGLISHNADRLGKTLWTEDAGGERIKVRGVWDGAEEARVVGDEIESHLAKGQDASDIAILVRAGFQTREFEERLITLGVPYRVIGGPRFYERAEIRDAIAYFRVTVQPHDDLAFERIVNLPRRGLGNATLQVIHALARAQRVSLTEATRRLIETDEIKPKPRHTLANLLGDFDRWRAALAYQPHPEIAAIILDECGYTNMWKDSKQPDAPGRLENLKELINALREFESLPGFLEHIALVMENAQDDTEAKVNLMTLHGAKGLEFDTVFLPGWEEGLFPHQRALDDGGLAALEEERRLAYVGLTRARRRAMVLHAANRRVYNQWQSALPSRFVDELPLDHIERDDDTRSRPQDRQNRFLTDDWYTPVSGGPQMIDAGLITGKTSAYAPGERVFHQKFGYGRVASVDGDKLTIDFEMTGVKKVLESFVQPAR
ncbi:MAG: ATP-dependent helicase [Magnetospiraceae bacterium]